MASVVSICNLALSNIGKDNIQALTDAGAEARACSQFYEHTRDILLQGYPWRFAGATVSLAQMANDRIGQWSYAYARPSDCMKVRWLRPQYSENDPALSLQDELAIPYEIEGQTIYCNLSPAFLRYTSLQADPTKFPPLFIEALGWHLAVRLAMPLTRDPKVRAEAYQMATMATGQAQMMDANEARETSDHESVFAKARAEAGGVIG
jgi:hypothetical protein